PHQVRADRLPSFPDLTKNGLPRACDAQPDAPTYLFVRGDDRNPDRSKAIPPGVPEALGGLYKVEPVPLPKAAYAPDRRPFVIEETLQGSAAAVEKAKADLAAARRDVLRLAAQGIQPDPLGDAATFAAGRRVQDALELADLEVTSAEAKHASL